MEKFEKIRVFFKEYEAKEALLIDLKEAANEVKPESVKTVIQAQIKVAEADLKELKERFELEFASPVKEAMPVSGEEEFKEFKELVKEAFIIKGKPEQKIEPIEPEVKQVEEKPLKKAKKVSIYRINKE